MEEVAGDEPWEWRGRDFSWLGPKSSPGWHGHVILNLLSGDEAPSSLLETVFKKIPPATHLQAAGETAEVIPTAPGGFGERRAGATPNPPSHEAALPTRPHAGTSALSQPRAAQGVTMGWILGRKVPNGGPPRDPISGMVYLWGLSVLPPSWREKLAIISSCPPLSPPTQVVPWAGRCCAGRLGLGVMGRVFLFFFQWELK